MELCFPGPCPAPLGPAPWRRGWEAGPGARPAGWGRAGGGRGPGRGICAGPRDAGVAGPSGYSCSGAGGGSGAEKGGYARGRRVAGTMEGQSGRCKIVVVGDAECGKTALLQVFAKDAYPGVRDQRLGRGVAEAAGVGDRGRGTDGNGCQERERGARRTEENVGGSGRTAENWSGRNWGAG